MNCNMLLATWSAILGHYFLTPVAIVQKWIHIYELEYELEESR